MPRRIIRRRVSVPRRASRKAVYTVCFAFGIAMLLVFVSILRLQKLHKAYAGEVALSNNMDVLKPIRGNIYDREEHLIAGNQFGMEVKVSKIALEGMGYANFAKVANLLNINNTKKFYNSLLRKRTKSVLLKEYSYENFDYNYLSRELIKLKMSNVLYFIPKNYRYYPKKHFYSSFFSYANKDCSLRWGVEEKFNNLLKGEEGYRKYIYSKKLPLFEEKTAVDGDSLYLTIDSAVQFVVEKSLKQAVLKNRANAGHVIVTKPKTGEILAIASYYRKSKRIKSGIVSDVYEPGSTIKPIIAAIAFESGKATPSETIFCENGRYKVGRRTVRDHHRYGNLTLQEVLWHSSNVGMVKVGSRLTERFLYNSLKNFGFGEKTKLPIPAESKGLFYPLNRWDSQTKTSISFGYGISVNAVQMTAALNAVVNGGYYIRPKLVKKIVGSDGKIIHLLDKKKKKVISEVTSSTMRNILRGVVKFGTGKEAYIEGLDIGGKTGTTKKIVNGKYSNKQYVASFYGFFPAFDPEISIYIIVDNPQGGEYYGGKVAAPLFKTIAKRIYPFIVEELDSKHGGLASVVDLSKYDDGILKNRQIQDKFVEVGVVPDLRGMLLRDALRLAHQAGFNVRCVGDGIVRRQSKAPGTMMKQGGEIVLKCMNL
jgi:cell division protein FtsI (penicillin-binding protein 3)